MALGFRSQARTSNLPLVRGTEKSGRGVPLLQGGPPWLFLGCWVSSPGFPLMLPPIDKLISRGVFLVLLRIHQLRGTPPCCHYRGLDLQDVQLPRHGQHDDVPNCPDTTAQLRLAPCGNSLGDSEATHLFGSI